jgi:hypothetical protein
MQRAKYAATFVCIALSVVSVFFCYRSTTTSTDVCIIYLSPTRALLFVTDDGVLYAYLETRQSPILPFEWAETSRINTDSKYRIGENIWTSPRFHATPVGIGWGSDERRVLAVSVRDTGVRIALPLLAALFLIPPAVRGYRALRRRRVSPELSRDLGQNRLDA